MASDQLVVFGLSGQKYALTIDCVAEIVRMMNVTAIPDMQYYYKGIVNLRGAVTPVISLSLRLGLEEEAPDKDSRIIVAEAGGKKIGLIVDRVYAVTRFDGGEVSDPESVGEQTDCIKGIVRQGEDLILLLDLIEVMS